MDSSFITSGPGMRSAIPEASRVLMWMMSLHLHVNQKSAYVDDLTRQVTQHEDN